MTTLHSLKNSHRPSKRTQRVGRGDGSQRGKTCGRGTKGMGARSGSKQRHSYEGGQMRQFMKIPIRGFNHARFRTEYQVVNLGDLDKIYVDGDVVNVETLMQKGRIGKGKVKLLGKGELTKRVTIQLDAISEGAKEKLKKANIAFSE